MSAHEFLSKRWLVKRTRRQEDGDARCPLQMFHKFGVTLTSYHSCAYVQVIEHGESKLALEGQRQNGGTENGR